MMYSNIRDIYTSALAKNNSRVMRLQLQECVNSKGILFTIYRHRFDPSSSDMLQYRSFMNGTFGVTYEQLQPKLSLSAGPSATKHGPNREWRDDESSVYPPSQEAGRWCICALGWREPGLVLRTPVAS
jgi:hypothetical protein